VTPSTPLISSPDNPRLARVRRLRRDPGAYRRTGVLWLEGDHLLRACLARGWPLQDVLIAASAWQQPSLRDLAQRAQRSAVLSDALFSELSTLESPASIGALVSLPAASAIAGDQARVVLVRLEDAGDVGSILRSAAAFGVAQVLALKGTAALWSPKVLRAGMGAHFALQLHESLDLQDLQALTVPWVATSSHVAATLHDAALPQPCAWIFGHEGQGVDAALAARCALTLSIVQPGGEESLNVAAAAAIFLHESVRRGQ
jgi:TrmH family RNA methyltransferase